jgi:hypothetical protein
MPGGYWTFGRTRAIRNFLDRNQSQMKEEFKWRRGDPCSFNVNSTSIVTKNREHCPGHEATGQGRGYEG